MAYQLTPELPVVGDSGVECVVGGAVVAGVAKVVLVVVVVGGAIVVVVITGMSSLSRRCAMVYCVSRSNLSISSTTLSTLEVSHRVNTATANRTPNHTLLLGLTASAPGVGDQERPLQQDQLEEDELWCQKSW